MESTVFPFATSLNESIDVHDLEVGMVRVDDAPSSLD